MGDKEKDWTALPQELIQIITRKLPDHLDFIRFRATCKTWRSSKPFSNRPPQLPWFLELSEGMYNRSEKQRFYSVSSCQTVRICFYQSKIQNWIDGGVFSHYRIYADETIRWGSCSHDCYWQGMFLYTGVARATQFFNYSRKKLLHNIPPPEDELTKSDEFDKDDLTCPIRKSYLVESLGIIFRVFWVFDIQQKEIVEDSIFHIYMLEFNGLDGQSCWVRVHNIGNQILFLEGRIAFSKTARPSTGFRKGCIYFINPFEDKPYVYDVLAGTVERVPCPFERCTLFLPSPC